MSRLAEHGLRALHEALALALNVCPLPPFNTEPRAYRRNLPSLTVE